MEVQAQQVVLQGVFDALVPAQARDHLARGGGVLAIHAPGVLAGLLGLVHGGVGVGDQILGSGGMVRIDRHAEAAGQPQAVALEAERYAADGAHDALGERFRLLVGDVGSEDRELVAAQPREQLVAAHLGRHFAGHPDQQGVAGAVAEGVVDVLELVEVEEQQRHASAPPLSAGQHAGQLLLEAVPVVQPGERIALGQIQDLIGRLALARDVLEQPEVADQLVGCVAHRIAAARDEPSVAHLDLHRGRRVAVLGQP